MTGRKPALGVLVLTLAVIANGSHVVSAASVGGARVIAGPGAAPAGRSAPANALGAHRVALAGANPDGSPLLGPVRKFDDPAQRERWIDARIESLAAPLQDDPYTVIDTCIAAEMEAIGAPGASIAIAVNGVISYTKGYGVRHPVDGGAIDSETMFGIGSTTKMMTAAALMTLVQDGQIDLHAPVTSVAPELTLAAPWDLSDITPHHLLAQSSGLPDSYRLPHTVDEFFTLELEEWVTDGLSGTAANAPPGSFWNYANPNFSLAGYLVERATGVPYEQAIEQRVWEPSGMPLTTFDMDAVKGHANYATGVYAGDLYGPGTLPVGALGPAGMAFSTPTELVTWALAMSGGANEVLSAESVAAMKAKHSSLGYDPWEHYGYGIFVTDYHDAADPSQTVQVFEHGGNIFGYGSQLFWVPERGLAFSILDGSLNSMGYSAGCVLRELGRIAPPSALDVPPDVAAWDAIEGSYALMNQVQWDSTTRLVRSGDRMMFEDSFTGASVPLVNLFGRTFFMDADGDGSPDPETAGYDYTFVDDDAGEIAWMRNRLEVGQMVGDFPASLAIEGNGCTNFAFQSAMNAPRAVMFPAGLTEASRPLLDQPISQDDPGNPTTASWKYDFSIRGSAAYAFFSVVPEPADELDLYMLYDGDEDGEFRFPEEVVDTGYEADAGAQVLYLRGWVSAFGESGSVPGGDYQAWVHGVSVASGDHTFDWGATVVDGEDLQVDTTPQPLVAGQQYQSSVCASDTEGLTGPLTGLVVLDWDSPPRRILTRVDWTPATGWPLYLPVAKYERMP